jgi:hypothetical protein
MEKKLAKKATGRPTKKEEANHEKECMKYYESFKSAAYAAEQIGIHRHSAEEYYKKFKKLELEEPTEEFIQGQRYAKAMTIRKLDKLDEKVDNQIKRCEGFLGETGDVTADGINFERILQRSLMDSKEMSFQKAELIMTPTLDLEIVAAIAKRDGESNKETTESKPTGKKRSK